MPASRAIGGWPRSTPPLKFRRGLWFYSAVDSCGVCFFDVMGVGSHGSANGAPLEYRIRLQRHHPCSRLNVR
jgi:hypothetical protein